MADTGKIVALIKALAPVADPAVIEAAVSDWLDEHGVVIADGSITEEKLAESLSAILARVDGYYEQMTVGNAEQLVSTVGVEDKVPYLFRTSGGSADIGNRENDMVVGGTVAWNQLVPTTASTQTVNDVTFTNNGDGSWTINGTASAYTSVNIAPIASKYITGHKWLLLQDNCSIGEWGFDANGGVNRPPEKDAIFVYGFNGVLVVQNGVTVNNQKIRPMVFDLTQMFGSTIADYIYSLETANAGAGVAFFRKLFPSPYYAYNPGELMSVQTSAHKLVGFNILPTDLVWKKGWSSGTYVDRNAHYISTDSIMRVVPGMTYCFYMPSITNLATVLYVVYFDANKTYIKNSPAIGVYTTNKFATFTIPDGVYYISVELYRDTEYTGNEGNGVCINLSWDGERDGEYEPYTVHSYALDSDLVLRGIPKLDANNALFYDGDTYESDGTVTRKFGIVDLGTLTWLKEGYQFGEGYDIFYAAVPNALGNVYTYGITQVCSKYVGSTVLNTNIPDKSCRFGQSSTNINVFDSALNGMTTAQVKTAMSGVYLVYELATPITETADPYQNPQIVDDFGTEEYVDAAATAETNPRDVAVPVGHVTEYQNNLRAKLEMAPESPSGDGDYIVRQTNGENVYVLLTFPADELPAVPTTDGDYRLKCTVSEGTATFSWEEIV